MFDYRILVIVWLPEQWEFFMNAKGELTLQSVHVLRHQAHVASMHLRRACASCASVVSRAAEVADFSVVSVSAVASSVVSGVAALGGPISPTTFTTLRSQTVHNL